MVKICKVLSSQNNPKPWNNETFLSVYSLFTANRLDNLFNMVNTRRAICKCISVAVLLAFVIQATEYEPRCTGAYIAAKRWVSMGYIYGVALRYYDSFSVF